MSTYQEQKQIINLSETLIKYDSYKKLYQISIRTLNNLPTIVNKDCSFKINFETTANKHMFLNMIQNINVIMVQNEATYDKIIYKFKTKDLISADTYIILKLAQHECKIFTCTLIFEMKNIYKLIAFKFNISYFIADYSKFCLPPNKMAFQKMPKEDVEKTALIYDDHNKFLFEPERYYMLIQDSPTIYMLRQSQNGDETITMKCAEIDTHQNVSILQSRISNYKLFVVDIFGNERKFADCFDIFDLNETNINDERTSIFIEYDTICIFKKKKNMKLLFKLRKINDANDYPPFKDISLKIIANKIKEKYNCDIFWYQ